MKSFNDVWQFLKGKKTFILAVFGVIATGLYGQGYIDEQMYTLIMGGLGSLGLATVRHAVK
jgi:type IV secretory pathway VirB2 component (pilin)